MSDAGSLLPVLVLASTWTLRAIAGVLALTIGLLGLLRWVRRGRIRSLARRELEVHPFYFGVWILSVPIDLMGDLESGAELLAVDRGDPVRLGEMLLRLRARRVLHVPGGGFDHEDDAEAILTQRAARLATIRFPSPPWGLTSRSRELVTLAYVARVRPTAWWTFRSLARHLERVSGAALVRPLPSGAPPPMLPILLRNVAEVAALLAFTSTLILVVARQFAGERVEPNQTTINPAIRSTASLSPSASTTQPPPALAAQTGAPSTTPLVVSGDTPPPIAEGRSIGGREVRTSGDGNRKGNAGRHQRTAPETKQGAADPLAGKAPVVINPPDGGGE
jgi:hypothetical protein